MGWQLTTGQKIRTAAALAIVFLLILATNLIDSHHFELVQKNMTSIYQDRLLTKNYLYKVSRLMQIKQKLLYEGNYTDKLSRQANDSIQVLLDKYAKSRLAQSDSKILTSLQKDLTQLYQLEQSPEEVDLAKSLQVYEKIFTNIDALSEIQIGEGKRKVDRSNKSIETSNLISRLEIGALILIGVILQVLIFIKPLKQ